MTKESYASTERPLSDEQFRVLQVAASRLFPRGRPPADTRRLFEAIFFIADSELPWRNLPASFGKWETAYRRYLRIQKNGCWRELLEHLEGSRSTQLSVKIAFLDLDREFENAARSVDFVRRLRRVIDLSKRTKGAAGRGRPPNSVRTVSDLLYWEELFGADWQQKIGASDAAVAAARKRCK
ncbi:MAG: transposase [Methylobacteriaceae bacterium]|nr:transposase [Methylobacteriaceae bacterium]